MNAGAGFQLEFFLKMINFIFTYATIFYGGVNSITGAFRRDKLFNFQLFIFRPVIWVLFNLKVYLAIYEFQTKFFIE